MASSTTKLSALDCKNACDREEMDEVYIKEIVSLFRQLRSHSVSNIEYFRESNDVSGQRFFDSFKSLHEHIDHGIEPGVEYILSVARLYDFDPSTPGNGYRSLVRVVERCCTRLLSLNRYVSCNRDSFLFRNDHYSREVEAYVAVLGQLRACLYYMHKFISYCSKGILLPDEECLSEEEYSLAQQILGEVESLSQECFYGRCLGFQFCDSMVRPLVTINLVLASFSEGYGHSSSLLKIASSVIGSRKYILDPELRAERVIDVTRNGDINFCKAFWSLNENQIMHKVPAMVCPTIAVDNPFEIPPTVFELPLADGSDVIMITPPCAHSGPGPVSVRLISYECRLGQEINPRSSNRVLPKSDGLLIHCHGGGFVAQSSASHQVYLRNWAKELNVPILCVDYSLAPEHPYPRQLEEVFFAYCWALKNCDKLGTSAKRVCIVGDSAGGNLAVATALKAVAYGIRKPDAVLSIYGCLLVKYAPSPSRILSLMDPLLPLGILPKCLEAYAGIVRQKDSEKDSVDVFKFPAVVEGIESLNTDHQSSEQDSKVVTSQDSVIGRGSVEKEEGASLTTIREKYQTHRTIGSGDSGFLDSICQDSLANHPFEDESVSESLPSVEVDGISVIKSDGIIDVVISDEVINGDMVTQFSTSQASPAEIDSVAVSTVVMTHPANPGKPGQSHPARPEKLELNLKLANSRQTSFGLHKRSISSPTFVTPVDTPSKLNFVSAQSSVSSPLSPKSCLFTTPTYAKMRHFAQSPIQQLHQMSLDRNPYMSPVYASDELLQSMCSVFLVTCHLDPMLDDSVFFARRLKSLGKPVHLDILDGLPHGFLNFVLMSRDARQGSELCIRRLTEILLPAE